MSLTADEKSAIGYYTALGYLRVNACLRDGKTPDLTLTGHISALDSAIAKSGLTVETTVYRGYPKLYADFLRDSGLGIGSVLYDDAFLSTSQSQDAAQRFAEWPDGIMFRIRIPKGSNGLDVSPYSKCPEEKEILLPRGTGLRIVAYDRAARVLDAEVV